MRIQGETVWLTQAQLVLLFQSSKANISEHIKHIFEEGELERSSVVRKFRTTASDGKTYEVEHFNLDLIISLGYRVKSRITTRFRQWATALLKEYIVKGFTMDDERQKEPLSKKYRKELQDRICDRFWKEKKMDKVNVQDIQYELRMLLGAVKLCESSKKDDIGNIINYFKDSVYVHTRNLYNFFMANASNDAKVTAFGDYFFDSELYRTWKSALHNHVLHIKPQRNNPNNVISGKHLNEMTLHFKTDISRLWDEWIKNTTDKTLKKQLEEAKEKAEKEAQDDCKFFRTLLKENITS